MTRRSENNGWERMISKYVVGAGVPMFSWDGIARRFQGPKGLRFTRYSTFTKKGWNGVSDEFKRYNTTRKNPGEHGDLVMFVVNKQFGPSISDTYVVTRLDTFSKILSEAVTANPERYYRKE